MSRGRIAVIGAGVVAAPVLLGLAYSVAAAAGWIAHVGDTFEGATRIWRVTREGATWSATVWSLWVSFAATLLAFVMAVSVAAAFRGSSRADRMVRISATLPFAIPHVVAGLLGLLILGQSGMLARLAYTFNLIETPAQMPALVYDQRGIGLILSLAWKEFAFLVFVAWSILTEHGDRLEETARTLGAGPLDVFRRVTLPMLSRALLPATFAVFTFVLGSYEAAALLAPSDPMPLSVLTIERYYDAALATRADAYVLAVIGFLLAALAVVIHQWMRLRWGRFT